MTDALLKVDDVCKLLGVTRSWVYDQIEMGRFPVVVLGRRSYRFKPEDIQKFIDARHQAALATTAPRKR